jgi:hypothetical protein
MTDPETTAGMVALARGYQVPEHFTGQVQRQVGRTLVSAEVTVEMIDGKPYVRALAFGVRDPAARPLPAADLSEISLRDILDSAMVYAAMQHTPLRWQPETDAPVFISSFTRWAREQWTAHERGALDAARAARSQRRITPDDLRRVLAIHATKGVEGIMNELGYSERNARRLLARARKELP